MLAKRDHRCNEYEITHVTDISNKIYSEIYVIQMRIILIQKRCQEWRNVSVRILIIYVIYVKRFERHGIQDL